MVVNNWHLLKNRKWSLHDLRLPLTPDALLAGATEWLTCQGYSLGPPAMLKRDGAQEVVGWPHGGAGGAEAGGYRHGGESILDSQRPVAHL